MLRDIRIDCLKNLVDEDYNPICGEDNIFLISNHHQNKWDFDRLTQAILDVLPRYQRECLTLSLNTLTSLSREILKRKVDVFKRRTWLIAFASALVACAPLPGLSFSVDATMIFFEIRQYIAQLGIPSEGSEIFEILSDTIKQEVASLCLNFSSIAKIVSFFTLVGSPAAAVEEVARFIPVIGLATASTLSFAGTFSMLRTALNRVETVALAVLEDAAQKSVDDFDLD